MTKGINRHTINNSRTERRLSKQVEEKGGERGEGGEGNTVESGLLQNCDYLSQGGFVSVHSVEGDASGTAEEIGLWGECGKSQRNQTSLTPPYVISKALRP